MNPYIGYEQAAALAKEALATGKTIRELAREKKLLPEEQLQRGARSLADDAAGVRAEGLGIGDWGLDEVPDRVDGVGTEAGPIFFLRDGGCQ